MVVSADPFLRRKQVLKSHTSVWRKWDPRQSALMADIFRRLRAGPVVDLEDHPLDPANGRATASHPPWQYSRRSGMSGSYSQVDPETRDVLRKKRDEAFLREQQSLRIPVLPKARSSSVQMPSVFVTYAATASIRSDTGREGLHQRHATTDGTNPMRRVSVPTQPSSRRYESMP
ncbi:hypothetical protein VTO42DRAFT_1488 [Malbranchea cinnamomea]